MAGSEQRFLESYKGHMEAVARELAKFKQTASERTFQYRQEQRITKLQA
jgi:hypothetical protein